MSVRIHKSQSAPRGFPTGFTIGLCLSAFAFALRIPYWGCPFNMDEGLYAYGAWRMLDGLVLYRDLIDFKPPGVYFLHALNSC